MYYKKKSFGKRRARPSAAARAAKKAYWRGVRAGKRMAFRKKRRW